MTALFAPDCECTYQTSMGEKKPTVCFEHGNRFVLASTYDRGTATSRPRKPQKRSEPKRDWTLARAKVELEGACRYCHVEYKHLEAAHLIGRKHDEPHPDGTKRIWVNPDRIIPLCAEHHRLFDAHQLDLIGYLSLEEQLRAVSDCGSLEIARRRLAPSAYVESLAS